jgi:regulator of protease activity HflC (stomatin/prohibitin superfamily)
MKYMAFLGLDLMIWLVIIILIIAVIAILAGIYTIVPADYADVVIQKGRMRVFSPHKEYSP